MKLVRSALIGAATLSLVVSSTIAAASNASSLSLSRAATAGKRGSNAVPVIPTWLAVGLVVGVVAGAAVLATTEEPDSN